MSRMLMIMMAVSLGTTACQKTKQRSYTPPPQPAAAPQAQPQQQGPIFNSPPPPPVQTDDTDGQIGQPGGHGPIVVGPPVPPPQQDPPFNPPPNNPPMNPPPSNPPPPPSAPPPAPPVNNPPPNNPPPPVTQEPPPDVPPPPPPPTTSQPPPSTPPPAPTPVPTNPLDIPNFTTQEPPPAPSPVDPNLPPPPAPLQPPPATQNPPNVNVNQEPPPPPPPAPVTPPPPAAPTPTDPNQPVLKVNLNDEPKPLPIEPPPCLDPKGCGVVPVRPEEPPKQEDCRETRTCKPATPVVDRCTAPLEIDKKRNQLDILFVVDTSKSLTNAGVKGRSEGELAQIGQGMLEYVKSLDPETDYNIGVLTGHGPASPYFGKLIANDGPAVIKYSDIRRGRSTEQAQKEVARLLKRKMLSVPNESGGAQGEAMLLALYSIMDKSRLEQATHQGMFRSEAALNVIFVTDEQDVCFDYAGTDYKPTLKTKIVKGKKEQFEDPYERDFFKDVCSRAIGGKWDKKKHIMTPGEGFPVTPGRVAQRLQTLKNEASGGKLIMNAIVYNAPVPESLKGQVEDENEMAHGIIDFVQIFGQSDGIVSLADVYTKKSNFGPELSATGKLVKFRLKTENKFSCASNTHPDAINYTSLSAKLIDSRGQLVGVFSAACSKEASSCEGVTGSMDFRPMVDTRTGKSHAQIVVDPKALEYVIKTYNVEGGQWEVEFWTSSDRNREDGSQINGPIPAKKTSPRAQQSPDMRSASGKSKASAKARR